MADFFTRLGARTLGLAPVARPRMATPYEAASHLPELNIEMPAAAPRATPHSAAETAGADLAPAARAAIAPPALAPRLGRFASIRPAERPQDLTFAASDDAAPGAPRPAPFRPLVSPVASMPSAPVPRAPAAQARPHADGALPQRSEPSEPAPTVSPSFAPPRAAGAARPDASPVRTPWRDARAADAPTVQVTIGRVEVRAAPPPAPLPAQRRSALRSLDDYLQPQRRN
jgi:hypothetical protein